MENRRNRRSVEEERYGDLQRYLDDRQYDDGDRPEDDRRARNSRMDDTGGRF